MTRRAAKKTLIIAVLIVAALVAVGLALRGRRVEVEVTAQQIQQKLDEKLPAERTYSQVRGRPLPVSCWVKLENPRVSLTEGLDRATAGMDATMTLDGPWGQLGPVAGSCDVSFGVHFDAATGDVFLTDCRIESIHIEGVPAYQLALIREFGSMAVGAVLDRLPVYTLTAKDTKTAIARLVLKNAAVRNGVLVVSLGL